MPFTTTRQANSTLTAKARLHRFNISCDTISKAGMSREMKYLWVHDDHKIYLYNPRQKMTKIYPLMNSPVSGLFVTDRYIYSIYNDGKLYSYRHQLVAQPGDSHPATIRKPAEKSTIPGSM